MGNVEVGKPAKAGAAVPRVLATAPSKPATTGSRMAAGISVLRLTLGATVRTSAPLTSRIDPPTWGAYTVPPLARVA